MRVLHFDCFSGISGDMTVAALIDAGVDPEAIRAALDSFGLPITLEIEKVKRNSETTSRAFVQLFLDQVWKPFVDAGQPNDRWPDITESIERLRPLASEAVLATFKQTMEAEVESAFGKVLEQQSKHVC